jgi:outer membrane immunogenic protein
MIKSVMSILALAALPIATASAADMPLKAPPMPYAGYSWTGFYLGGEVGGGWVSNSTTVVTASAAAFPAGTPLNTINSSGVLGGFYGGYNYQINQIVLGIDGEFNWAGLTGSASTKSTVFPIFSSNASDKVTWVSTVTGRLGWANNNWLFFVKGGGAWAQFNGSSVTTGAGGAVTGTGTSSSTRSGWTVGTGVEYGFAPHWSLKLEYDYIGFSTASFNSTETSGVVGARSATSNINEAKGGIAYRF